MLPSHVIEAIFASRGGQSTSAPKPRSARENGSKAGDLGGIGLRLPELVLVLLFVDLLGNIG